MGFNFFTDFFFLTAFGHTLLQKCQNVQVPLCYTVRIFAVRIFLQVAGLFRDPSIGNAINIVIVRLILLEQDEVSQPENKHASQ